MGEKLVVVESPAKARTLSRFLGPGYSVKASVGHIRDLPKSSLGLKEEEGWEPIYQVLPEKKKVVEELRRAAQKAEEVILAADPDREGEAICWHVQQVLADTNKPFKRIEFHEITRKAVQDALRHPRPIDMNRVAAQQARRVIDRLMGYKISPLLWEKVKRGLSAGRVQSVALKLVCDREAEIEAFVPEEYWVVQARVSSGEDPEFVLKLAKKDGKKWRPSSKEEAEAVKEAILSAKPLVVSALTRKTRRQKPKPPFITSQLQQEAARRFKFPVRKTMRIAQSLYEGVDLGERGRVGLITYMRTDSVRIADEAVEQVRGFIEERWGKDALPSKPNVFKSKATAQEAHEAIRPTDVRITPEDAAPFLTEDQRKLYRLIWERFVACQMKSAIWDVTEVQVDVGPYQLSATGKVLKDPGFLRVWREEQEDDKTARLPANLEQGTPLELLGEVELEQKWTQPPPRYTEGTLVKTLEEKGIGRPSTYATIIATLSNRDYVVKEKGAFKPTELGKLVNRLLTTSFSRLIAEGYTASLEQELDRIATGGEDWKEAVGRFAAELHQLLKKAEKEMEQVKGRGLETDRVCPKCGSRLVVKFGRYGEFLACSAWPKCDYTADLREGDGVEDDKDAPACPECGGPMQRKRSRFGFFWACKRYPECKGKLSISKGKASSKPVKTGVACPAEGCDGELVARRTKTGRLFYGCSRYPKCTFAMWNRPVAQRCPKCGFPVMGERARDLKCPSCGATSPKEPSQADADQKVEGAETEA